jgi:hypothetical protein
MAQAPKKATATRELGASGSYGMNDQLRPDEFLPKLRGLNATRTFREMKDNDPVIGAILMAFEMLLRAAEFRVEAVNDSPEAEEAKLFVEQCFADMEGTVDDFLAEVLTFLPFGFSVFEVVYKIRGGRNTSDTTRYSQFDDGRYGIQKLAPRAQWTIDRFLTDANGAITGVRQTALTLKMGSVEIPIEKLLHFRTSTINNDPSGRSILRNAFTSYHYASHIQMIEAIAVEREMNGIPVGRIPSEYLADSATAAQQGFTNAFKKILRDVKFNDQGFILIPSDVYENDDGSKTSIPMVQFDLVTAKGTRAIPTGEVILRHQQNIARSVLADFLMLGSGDKGSFALSKSKTDLFLAAAAGYTEAISSVLNRQLLTRLWELNGFDPELMPSIAFGDIAPVDLAELGAFVRDIAGAGMPLFPDDDTENTIRRAAGFPEKTMDPDLLGAAPVQPLDTGVPSEV